MVKHHECHAIAAEHSPPRHPALLRPAPSCTFNRANHRGSRGRRHLVPLHLLVATTIVVAGGACIIPPNLSVSPIDTQYKGVCRCETCTQFNPETLVCEVLVSRDTELFECGQSILAVGEVAETDILPKFEENCEALEMPGTTCGLTPIDDQHLGSDFLVVTDSDVCRTDTSSVAHTGVATPFWSKASVTSGTMEIIAPNGSGTANVTGQIQFIGGNCTTGSCPFRIVFVNLHASPFSLGGESVGAPFLLNTTLGEGTFFPGPGLFVIPGGGLQVLASGTVGGTRRGVLATSVAPGVGLLNQSTRQLVFSQQLEADDVDVNITIAASIDNLAPTVLLPTPPQVECNAPGGATIAMPLLATDPDGQISNIHWYLDGQLVLQNVTSPSLFVPLGTHTIDVWVFDNQGSPGTASRTITVADTTPPTVEVDQVCLWPPNHELLLITSDMIRVTDTCDPNASVVFSSGTSNQSDDGLGDGNTTGDLVVNPDAVCARAERNGMVLEGREYTILATVQDASNSNQVAVTIKVPHDASEACDIFDGEAVSEDDARCIPHPIPKNVTQSGDSGLHAERVTEINGGGCGSTRGGGLLSVLAVLLLVRRRVRRDAHA